MGCVYSTPQRPLFRRSDEGGNSNNGTGGGGGNGLSATIIHSGSSIACGSGAASGITGDAGSKVFDVINVDDRGNEINHGQIEITENDLILHQRNKNSIVWPLRSLRRYGFDAELFSFECGRRCSTGPGIYAFKCVHAEQLFNVLQESLQKCSNLIPPNNHIISPQHGTNPELNGNSSVNISSGTPFSSSVIPTTPGPPELAARAPVPVPPPPLLPSSPPHSYVNDIRSYINSPFYANTAVLNGNLVGLPVSSSSHANISKGRAGSARSASDINTNYAKLDDLVDYVNIDTAVAQYQTGTSSSSEQTTTAVITSSNVVSSNTNPLANFETNECLSFNKQRTLNSEELKSSFVTPNSTTNAANEESNFSTKTNVKPTILPIKPLSSLASLSCQSQQQQPPSSPSSQQQQPELLISPKTPRKSESGISDSFELNETVEPVNYIILDLENTNTNNNNGPTYVTTGPATPIFKTPEEGSFILPGTTPPSTPTSIKSISSNYPPQSYATIDFDKTLALSNSAASHRKF